MRFSPVLKSLALVAWVLVCGSPVFGDGKSLGMATAGEGRPALLNDAFNALIEDQGRWAFTETHKDVQEGKAVGETVYRVDPSATYEEQFKPVVIRGKAPTERQLKAAAERGVRAAKKRSEHQKPQRETAEASEAGEKPKAHRADEVQLWINGQRVVPEVDDAKVKHEDDTSVTYEVPLRVAGKGDARNLLEKFELTARVNKSSHYFEHATIRQRTPVRVKLIAKVSDTVLDFEFSTPDPRYPSVLTKVVAAGHLRLLFGRDRVIHGEVVRSELKHVTPYDERFGVKMGTTRTIEF